MDFGKNIEIKNFINGEWTQELLGDTNPLFDPSTGNIIGSVPISSVTTSRAATKAARDAFPSWKATPLPKRMNLIFDLINALKENLEALAQSIAFDQGKHISEARGEVSRVIDIVQMNCSIPSLLQGTTIQNIGEQINGRVIRAPIGVFCGVAPFNFPALVFGWFIPVAIACGNTFVFKPSSESPLFMQLMMNILADLGLPKGVVNLVHGDKEVVESWYDDPSVSGICLVGSTPTAKAIAEGCGRTGKKTMLLGGAKNFLIAMDDAPLDSLVQNILMSSFGAAGQRCLAVSNVIATPGIHDQLVARLIEQAPKIKLGDARDQGASMGPVISSQALARIHKYIEDGENSGARLVLDGRSPKLPQSNQNGYFIGPTIFTDVMPTHRIAQEEIFGPVLSILRAGCIDSALKIVNSHPMGNGAVIFTQNSFYTEKFIEEAETGMIGVNVGICAPHPYMPFGGIKDSLVGNNKVQGQDAIAFFTQNKAITLKTLHPTGALPLNSVNADIKSCVAS